jgi:hypothetical protein
MLNHRIQNNVLWTKEVLQFVISRGCVSVVPVSGDHDGAVNGTPHRKFGHDLRGGKLTKRVQATGAWGSTY